MTPTQDPPRGIWLPLITPFRDGDVDEASLRRLLRHYAAQPLTGIILGATSGEGLTVTEPEKERMVALAAEELAAAGSRQPLYLGISGSDTRRTAEALARTAGWPLAGYLINCPAYSRPPQAGLYKHFEILAGTTEMPCLLYNIPYRTGVNLENDTLLRLAEIPNILGVKDCAANLEQSVDLMARKPAGFSVLTGEDALLYTALVHGGDGAISVTAHALPTAFAEIHDKVSTGDQPGALTAWRRVAEVPPLLFAEPSPAPVKHWLWRAGLIDSPEVRLPMMGVSHGLAARIEDVMARHKA